MAPHSKYSDHRGVSYGVGGVAFIFPRIGGYIQVDDVELCVVFSAGDEEASGGIVDVLQHNDHFSMLIASKAADAEQLRGLLSVVL